LLVLAHQALPEGSVRRVTGVVRNALALVLALGALLFAAEQARLALYPQLGGFPVFGAASAPASVMAPAPPLPAPQAPGEIQITDSRINRAELERDAVEPVLDKVQVTGSRISMYDLVSLVPEDARLQAGPGQPQWRWTTHRLHWSGPVLPDETFHLLLSPPWMTSLVRWLTIGLLGWLLWLLTGFFRAGGSRPARASARHAALLVAGLCAPLALPAAADTTPDPKLLDELRARLLDGPECADHCAALGAVRLQVGPDTLVIEQEWHLQAALAVPLVHEAHAQWMPASVRVDGAPVEQLTGLSEPMLVLQPGVHTVRLEGPLAGLDGLRLRFPLEPHAVRVQAEGWTVAGVGRGRVLGREVQLARQPTADEAPGEAPERSTLSQGPLPPFGVVERSFWLDREWQLTTTATRWDDAQGVVTLRIPLLPGEQVLDESLVVEDGVAVVTLSAEAKQVSWNSRIEPAGELVLQAPEFDRYAESWAFTVSPIWHAAFEGLPQTQPRILTDFWAFRFDPRPGETLALAVGRPAAVEGATLAIDEVNVHERIGRRQRDVSLHAVLRSTLGTEHRLRLPTDATLRSVSLDGRTVYLQPVDGVLSLPVTPGDHRLGLELTRPHGSALTVRATPFDLEADSANITRVVEMPADRWILAAWGPGIGPAILYWSVLAVVLLAAWVLSRIPLTPLKFHHWVLLGIGFSLFAWPVMVLVAAWLLTLGAVAKWPPPRRDDFFNLRQVALVVFSGVVLLSLVGAIPGSLLSRPDMQIAGPGSAGNVLQWFVDRSDGLVPVQHVLSLPMWAYKVVILAWALWLSLALVRWIRWAWEAVSAHGLWRGKVKQKPKADPA
ncbi:MAG: hypothetical protein R3233_08780, partial [Xanthomonadales bacterium]|nr:hypothetical protein [Xanthomonadales bacterium]